MGTSLIRIAEPCNVGNHNDDGVLSLFKPTEFDSVFRTILRFADGGGELGRSLSLPTASVLHEHHYPGPTHAQSADLAEYLLDRRSSIALPALDWKPLPVRSLGCSN
jgi:hypothetical protein